MDIESIVVEIIDLDERVKAFIPYIQTFLKDINISISRRWEAFTKVARHMPCQRYGDGFVNLLDGDLTLYDDFCIDRYQTTNFEKMLMKINESSERVYPDAAVTAWKEAVLASGYGSFIYDW